MKHHAPPRHAPLPPSWSGSTGPSLTPHQSPGSPARSWAAYRAPAGLPAPHPTPQPSWSGSTGPSLNARRSPESSARPPATSPEALPSPYALVLPPQPSWSGSTGPSLDARKSSGARTRASASIAPHTRSWRSQAVEQILPTRIHALDQIKLPRARPALEGFLPPDRGLDVLMPFHEDQPDEPVPGGKPGARTLPMLPGSPGNVVRHADTECAACSVRHDVDPAARHSALIGRMVLRKGERTRRRSGACADASGNGASPMHAVSDPRVKPEDDNQRSEDDGAGDELGAAPALPVRLVAEAVTGLPSFGRCPS